MFVNLNDITLPITASSTPTAYAIPSTALNCVRIRVNNACGSDVVVKGEISSTTTLVAPVSGTAYAGSSISNGTTEMFNDTTAWTHISVYSATGTGLVNLQFCYGQ